MLLFRRRLDMRAIHPFPVLALHRLRRLFPLFLTAYLVLVVILLHASPSTSSLVFPAKTGDHETSAEAGETTPDSAAAGEENPPEAEHSRESAEEGEEDGEEEKTSVSAKSKTNTEIISTEKKEEESGAPLWDPNVDVFRKYREGNRKDDHEGEVRPAGSPADETAAPVPATPCQEDPHILSELYSSLNGPQWVDHTRWLEPGVTCCAYHGVVCNTAGRILNITFYHNNLNGTLPASIGQFSELTSLIIDDSQGLHGPLPSSIGSLRKLETLQITNTQISGTIPEQVGRLQNLQYLVLSRNNLSGELPLSLGKLVKLRTIRASYNTLTGGMKALATLPAIEDIHLSYNQIKEPVPPEWEHLKASLRFLKLNNNLMTHTLPLALFELRQLEKLNLGSNSFKGPIPPHIGKLVRLEEMDLSNNFLDGPIPPEVGKLGARLALLNLCGNRLTGNLPQALLDLRNLKFLFLNGNNLMGSDFDPYAYDPQRDHDDLARKVQTLRLQGKEGKAEGERLLKEHAETVKRQISILKNDTSVTLAKEMSEAELAQLAEKARTTVHARYAHGNQDVMLSPKVQVVNPEDAPKFIRRQFTEAGRRSRADAYHWPDMLECDLSDNPFPCPVEAWLRQDCRAYCLQDVMDNPEKHVDSAEAVHAAMVIETEEANNENPMYRKYIAMEAKKSLLSAQSSGDGFVEEVDSNGKRLRQEL